MQFIVQSGTFLKAISPVIEVACKSVDKTFDSAFKLTIDASEKGITATSFGGKVAIDADISEFTVEDLNYKFISKGKITVNAQKLSAALASFDFEEEVVFNVKNIENSGKDLYILKLSDKEEYQTLSCFIDDVIVPAKATKFIKKMTISRNTFLSSVKRVYFAIGFEADMARYMHWVLRTDKDKISFAAGSGARFAILELRGKNIAQVTPEKSTFLFPKDHTNILVNVLSSSSQDDIIISQSDASEEKVPYQIVVNLGLYNVTLVGMNASIKWIDESKLLNVDYDYKVITKISDWAYVGKAVLATVDDQLKQERRPHKAFFNFDMKKNVLVVKTSDSMKSHRKVNIVSSDVKGTSPKEITSMALYFSEIPACINDPDGYCQVEFNKPENPVIVRYYASDQIQDKDKLVKQNTFASVDESFTMFFATLNE